jgi:hypothetical protein
MIGINTRISHMVDGKKIILEIDGTVVEGEIMQLYTNDIEVMITTPLREPTPVHTFLTLQCRKSTG